MEPVRKADCPNCGGPIEFKLGSAAACVCPWCRFSVVRKGQTLESIGQLAELVPSSPMMVVGDQGELEGVPFVVGGRLQLDHGQGPWDEWYIELKGGRWGWLAKAQGRFYLTHPLEGAQIPAWDAVEPGATVTLAASGDTRWTVNQRGGSALLSAEGELPFPAIPDSSGRYADLSAAGGLFATIDYGDGSEEPQLYLGKEVPGDRITVRDVALGPRPEDRTDAARLRCPTCGAPIEIHTPDTTERAACGSCQSLLDYSQGELHYLERLEQSQQQPLIPLGSKGVLRGEEAIVIGYLQRTTQSDGIAYGWQEYLLHTRNGYRWLVEDGYHFTLLRPISPGDVEDGVGSAKYQGQKFRLFSNAASRVRLVLGEFYWKVRVGDTAEVADYVAPPQLLSHERTHEEVSWSLGRYVEADDVWKAFELPGSPPSARGVAPAQPNPISLKWTGSVAAVLFLLLGLLAATSGPSVGPKLSIPLKTHSADNRSPNPDDAVVYSERFEVPRGPTTLELKLDTTASNAWVAAAAALIDEDTGAVREFFVQAEEWHGSSGGERWSEGSSEQTEYLGRVPAGRYTLRVDTRWGRQGGRMRGNAPNATMHVTAGERSSLCCFGSGILLLLPLILAVFRKMTFEAKRWAESDMVHIEID